MLAEAKPAYIDWLISINAFIDYQDAQSQAITDDVGEGAAGSTAFMRLLTGLAIVLAILIERTLAQRTGDATGQIESMLGRIRQETQ